MAYRNGTYIAFHANGLTDPTATDIKFYNLMKAWTNKKDDDFSLINSHEKNSAVRDSSKKATLRARLVARLNNSKHLVLILGETTKNDTDWVPFEIEHAIDKCGLPVIVVYTSSIFDTNYAVRDPNALSHYWPKSLKTRIENGSVNAIHIPFRKDALTDAISQFNISKQPSGGGYGIYNEQANKSFGLK
ncbi:TIR domain-containing protein [Vibrio splendidus]|uniref:TIR domain-containing protein n=1 Tax=Vibrio splendidus TaxID=29497 RepID=UPI0034A0B332